jgi:hypothetical protein
MAETLNFNNITWQIIRSIGFNQVNDWRCIGRCIDERGGGVGVG